MNTELPDCSKCLKPKKMQKSSGKQQHQHSRNKEEQPIDLDPAKAWIKNMGAGTTKQMTKLKNVKRDTLLATDTIILSTTTTSAAANTTKNESATASQTNGMQFGLDHAMDEGKFNATLKAMAMDITTLSIQKVNGMDNGESSEQSGTIGNATYDNDATNYQTCIELDTTLMNSSVAEMTDYKPTCPTPVQSQTMDFKPTKTFKPLPLELNTVLEDETSLYEPMGTMERMAERMKDPEKFAQHVSQMKREYNDHFDDTMVHESYPYGLDTTVKPSRAHELSVPLGSFDFLSSTSSSSLLSPSNLSDIKPALSSLTLDSTALPTNKPAKPSTNSNANIFDPHTPFKLPSYAEFKSDKKCRKSEKKSHKREKEGDLSDMSWSMLSKASSQVPNTPSLSKGAFIHPVYMRDEDVNCLIQSGHIFFTDGRLHYKHKNSAQKKIF